MAAVILAMAAFLFYMLPSIIADIRHVEHEGSIGAVNFLLGWTVLGWIAALIWAVVEKPRTVSRNRAALNLNIRN
jgi:hypothetical protein